MIRAAEVGDVSVVAVLMQEGADKTVSNGHVYVYDRLWASVMKSVPKLDESESGQMVLK